MLLSGEYNNLFISLIATLMALFVAMPFHEFAHAFAAKREGDYTAVACRRYTLAPLAHFNLWGFLFLLVFGFGWANPVPVDTRNFKRGKKSEFMVAIAGIVMNLLLGTIFLFIFMCLAKFCPGFLMGTLYGNLLSEFLVISVSFNFMLAFFNLLPLPALDGGYIVMSVVEMVMRKPVKMRYVYVLNFAALMLLMSLGLLVAVMDIFYIMGH
jgi:Zn-dependent protease